MRARKRGVFRAEEQRRARLVTELRKARLTGIRVPVEADALQGRLSGLPADVLVERDRIEVRFAGAKEALARLYALARGDSMLPAHRPAMVAIVSPGCRVRDGDEVYAHLVSGERLVRVVHPVTGGFVLEPYNRAYTARWVEETAVAPPRGVRGRPASRLDVRLPLADEPTPRVRTVDPAELADRAPGAVPHRNHVASSTHPPASVHASLTLRLSPVTDAGPSHRIHLGP